MKKFAEVLNGMIWTLAGTGLVLITLSGHTLRMGMTISIAALLLSMLGIILETKK